MSRLEELGALAPQASDKWTRIAKIPEPENHKMDDIIALYDMIGNETAQKQWITDAARRRKFEGLTVTGK